MASLLEKLLLPLVNPLCGLYPHARPDNQALQSTRLVAHRGAWQETGELENTLPAFEKAIAAGVWAVEFDLRWSRDGVPIVHHDRSLLRVFQRPECIEDLTAQELRVLEPRIPTLEEVLKLLKGRAHFFLELKETPNPEQGRRLLELLREFQPAQDFHLMAFETICLQTLQQIFPADCLVGIARTNIEAVLQSCLTQGWGGFTAQYLLVKSGHVQRCREAQIEVGTGFPDRASLLYREVERKVPWIFTNHPLRLAQLIKSPC